MEMSLFFLLNKEVPLCHKPANTDCHSKQLLQSIPQDVVSQKLLKSILLYEKKLYVL